MHVFSLFPLRRLKKRKAKKSSHPLHKQDQQLNRPALESLEARVLLSGNSISGHVFHDANYNGIFDPGEVGIANNPLELRNSDGQLVGTAITDANGFYEFTRDITQSTAPETLEQSVTIPATLAGFSIDRAVAQFDPNVGELIEVEVIHSGSITSDIRAENNSTHVGADITGHVSGHMTLSGPGFTIENAVSENAGNFFATPFDGSLDFAGSSGRAFTPSTAIAPTRSVKITGVDLHSYVGTGQVTLTEDVAVNSTASGGGNLLVAINSSATATFTVRYKYIPSDALRPGDYTIIQKEQPHRPGSSQRYLDGLESQNGHVIPNTTGTDFIKVNLGDNESSTDNNFGELLSSELTGFVYHDVNVNGVKDLGEAGIAGVAVNLFGTSGNGDLVSRTATTSIDGSYRFEDLVPGVYSIEETQPGNFLDGQDTIGSQGGTTENDRFTDILLPDGVVGDGYNFGELKSVSLAGKVYEDLNNNGVQDQGEVGIPGVTVHLTAQEDTGVFVSTTATVADGSYEFTDLRPGTFELVEDQPEGYADGRDTIGSRGGNLNNDSFTDIVLNSGAQGVNYNFGERIIADLAIEKTVEPETALAGETITYTLDVSNLGPSAAENVSVEDTLPEGMAFVSSAALDWTVENENGALLFTRDTLAAGEASTISVTAIAPVQEGTYRNTAVVSSATPETTLVNNTDEAEVEVPPGPTSPVVPHNPNECIVSMFSFDMSWRKLVF